MKQLTARLLFVLLTVLPAVAGAADISLFALFKDKAILHVEGARRVLAIGAESPEGVKLVSTDTQAEEAVVELNGKREILRLGVGVFAFQGTAGERPHQLVRAGRS